MLISQHAHSLFDMRHKNVQYGTTVLLQLSCYDKFNNTVFDIQYIVFVHFCVSKNLIKHILDKFLPD